MNSTLGLSNISTGLPSTRTVVAAKSATPPRRRKAPPSTTPAAIPQENSYDVVPSIHGNHLAIQAFLTRVLHRPSEAEFVSSTQRPGYDPSERLVVRRPSDRSLVAHMQLQPFRMRFGKSDVDIVRLRDLAVLPEYDYRGLSDRMVMSAELEARRLKMPLMVARGENYKLLCRHGWANIGSDPVSIVSPQRLLGQLPAPPEPESPFYADQMPRVEVRLGRLTDLASFQRLYETKMDQSHGAVCRSEEQWSWLVGRRAHTRIYLYLENDQPIAYGVVSGASLVELIDLTVQGNGAARLLEHVASDAIDQGRHSLRLHAPAGERVHEWANLAGGNLFAMPAEESWLVKIINLRLLLRSLAAELNDRQLIDFPDELGMRVGKESVLITRGTRRLKITRGKATRHSVEMTAGTAAQLLLGFRSPNALVEANRLFCSSQQAFEAVAQLLPAQSLWRGRWDDVDVIDS